MADYGANSFSSNASRSLFLASFSEAGVFSAPSDRSPTASPPIANTGAIYGMTDRSTSYIIPFYFRISGAQQHRTLRLYSTMPMGYRRIMYNADFQVTGGETLTDGFPTPPSLRLDSLGKWRFRWGFSAGTRTISVSVKQVVNQSPRPSMIIKNNPSIGVASDVVTVAPSGAGWVTIGPTTITPTVTGAVWVELWNNLDSQFAATPCFWDNINTT